MLRSKRSNRRKPKTIKQKKSTKYALKKPGVPFVTRVGKILILVLISLSIVFVCYKILLQGIFNYTRFSNVMFQKAVNQPNVVSEDRVWDKKDRISVCLIGYSVSNEGRKIVESVIILEIYPKENRLYSIEIPTEYYIQTEDSGVVQIKKLIAIGDLKSPKYGELFAVEKIGAASAFKFDKYLVYDQQLWRELLDTKGSISVRLPKDVQMQNQAKRFTVALFDESRIIVTPEKVFDYLHDDTGGQLEKDRRNGLFFEGILSSYNFFDLWKLSSFSETFEKFARSNFSPGEFKIFVEFLIQNSKKLNISYVDGAKMPTRIISTGETVRVLSGEEFLNLFRLSEMNQPVVDELARVEVVNGSNVRKAAFDYANLFRNKGIDVIRRNNAPRIYKKTIVYVQDDKRIYDQTVKEILSVLGEKVQVVGGKAEFLSTADIVVVLGEDLMK